MYDALASPPMPAWNDLRNEDREKIISEWEYCSCSHGCGDAAAFYDAIREQLIAREKYYLRFTMTEPAKNCFEDEGRP